MLTPRSHTPAQQLLLSHRNLRKAQIKVINFISIYRFYFKLSYDEAQQKIKNQVQNTAAAAIVAFSRNHKLENNGSSRSDPLHSIPHCQQDEMVQTLEEF